MMVLAVQVTVVSGATGCGKTTQIPQLLLDDALERGVGGTTSIICTQPRRISATAVAERVAAERAVLVGDEVGYSIRMEAKSSRDTRMLFCTTGILLRRLQSDPLLQGVSHVLVDEVHERDLNSDFLLIVLRDLLPRRKDLRIVAMSATVNADLFANYFSHVRSIPVTECRPVATTRPSPPDLFLTLSHVSCRVCGSVWNR
jgi:ATP-dependent RNA helicase DHX36